MTSFGGLRGGGAGGIDVPERARHHPAMPDFDVRLKSNGAYWLAYWPDPADPRKRKAKSLGPKAKFSRRQASALCRQLALDMKSGKVTNRNDIPRLSEWLETHRSEVAGLREATRVLYIIAGQYLTRHFDHDPRIDRITHNDAADWRATLASGVLSLDNKTSCDPPGETTICKHVRTVKAIFNAAVARKLIPENPFTNLRGNAPDPDSDWHQITPCDMAKILDACPNDGYRALFALARWCGLRRDEARQLQWGDVLWEKNRIVVNARVKNPTTKWHKRICPIELHDNPTGMMKLFRSWYDNALPGSTGPCQGVDRHNLYVRVSKILNAAGVVYAKPFHTARKCWETELAMRYPIHVVIAWLGNTLAVAERHYLRVPEEMYGEAPAATVPMIVVNDGSGHKVVPVPAATQRKRHGTRTAPRRT